MTTDQVIALGVGLFTAVGAFAAFASAFATFRTVREIAKQREASYRPELVIPRTLIKGNGSVKRSLPDNWVSASESSNQFTSAPWFAIPLHNIGLGAARNIIVNWSFPLNEMVKEVNTLAHRSSTQALFVADSGALSIKWEGQGDRVVMNRLPNVIDYVLPAAIQKEPVMLPLSLAYIELSSALVFFAKDHILDIPALDATVEYLDIGGQRYRAAFEIKLHIEVLFCSDGSFFGYLEACRKMVNRLD